MTLPAIIRSKNSGKPVRWRRVGVMDVGSNSVRLVVYDVRGRAMQPRFNEKVLAGLGRGLTATGKKGAAIWPDQHSPPGERIGNQIKFCRPAHRTLHVSLTAPVKQGEVGWTLKNSRIVRRVDSADRFQALRYFVSNSLGKLQHSRSEEHTSDSSH